jgi:eukaryotic-like serine/threonine-protein kinase
MRSQCVAVLENGSITDSTVSVPAMLDTQVALALEEYQDLLRMGLRPDLSEFLARHAAIAKPLRECLGGLVLVEGAAWEFGPRLKFEETSEQTCGPTRLGEFQIIREIGRGGMGVVYEAEQLSLGRHVALKVLPATASQDPRQRQRFQIEAQAAALLHHDHIVPVFGIGFDEGAHYYAMQLIDGQPLT